MGTRTQWWKAKTHNSNDGISKSITPQVDPRPAILERRRTETPKSRAEVKAERTGKAMHEYREQRHDAHRDKDAWKRKNKVTNILY